jgi:hypothetical protein
MAQGVPVKCICGKVTGLFRGLSAASTNHVRCACKGCQAYAHFLGRTDDMLDAQGFSHIFQMNPAGFEIRQGLEQVACMKVTPTGPLRWYTRCCNTPLGNTLPTGKVPFLGVLPICTGHKGTSDAVVAMVGPVRASLNGKPPVRLRERVRTVGMLARFLVLMIGWRLGTRKGHSPLFDADTLEPLREPLELTDAERLKLYEKLV